MEQESPVYKIKIVALFLFCLYGEAIFAKGLSSITSLNVGMYSLSVNENADTLVQTDTTTAAGATTEPETSAVSSISLEIMWEYLATPKRSFFLKGIVPLVQTEGAGVYLAGAGINWYLNRLGSKYVYEINGSELEIIPKFTYYFGVNSGVGYLVYNTESAQKTDVFFDLGAHLGANYYWGEKWGGKALLEISRGTGVATSSMGTKFFIGATYFL